MRSLFVSLVLLTIVVFSCFVGETAAEEKIPADSRCKVCGMFVAKYPNWLTMIRQEDGKTHYFDGVKDMLVYYFNPAAYGGAPDTKITEIRVKDYYTLQWIAGRSAFYVVGSDVYGPMGREFVPFSSKEAAESFLKDHKGKKILTLNEINDEMVQEMRSGMKMKHGE